jgi:hypothetical protein
MSLGPLDSGADFPAKISYKAAYPQPTTHQTAILRVQHCDAIAHLKSNRR